MGKLDVKGFRRSSPVSNTAFNGIFAGNRLKSVKLWAQAVCTCIDRNHAQKPDSKTSNI